MSVGLRLRKLRVFLSNWKLDFRCIIGSRNSEVFPIDGNQIMGVGLMLEVTRGQVDNENNSQSQYSNMSNNIQGVTSRNSHITLLTNLGQFPRIVTPVTPHTKVPYWNSSSPEHA